MIGSCKFGSIIIDGRRYQSDLIIYPDGKVRDSWRRMRGHRLSRSDIEDLIATEPAIIVVGTGVYGRMKVESALEADLFKRNIRLMAGRNSKAIAWFNEHFPDHRTGACFHLTC